MLKAAKTGKYLSATQHDVRVRIEPAQFQEFAERYDDCYKRYDALLFGQDVHRYYTSLIAHACAFVCTTFP